MTHKFFAPVALAAMVGAVALAGPASALTTFFAQDAGLPPVATAAERALFEAALLVQEDFDFEEATTGMVVGAATGQTGVATGGTMLSFVGDGEIRDTDTPQLQYAVSPVQYLRVKTSSDSELAISFGGAGVTAFGFYGSDIGDFDGELGLRLLDFFGDEQLDLGVLGPNGANGNLIFAGVTTGVEFFGVEFYLIDPTSDSDAFGIDDIIIGTSNNPSIVPLPGAGLLLISGIAGLAGLRRFKRKPV